MRSPFLILMLAFQLSSYAVQAQAARPIPPGIRRAEQTQAQNDERQSASPTPRRTIDLGKLKQDADELAALAQSVPPDVDQTAKGVLPKDLGSKLKRIEKLAKQLRSQLTP